MKQKNVGSDIVKYSNGLIVEGQVINAKEKTKKKGQNNSSMVNLLDEMDGRLRRMLDRPTTDPIEVVYLLRSVTQIMLHISAADEEEDCIRRIIAPQSLK